MQRWTYKPISTQITDLILKSVEYFVFETKVIKNKTFKNKFYNMQNENLGMIFWLLQIKEHAWSNATFYQAHATSWNKATLSRQVPSLYALNAVLLIQSIVFQIE